MDESSGDDGKTKFALPSSSSTSRGPGPPPPKLELEGEPMTLSEPTKLGVGNDTNSESMRLGSGNATGSGRTKVALKPGRSLMDWIKLTAKAKDLAGTGGKLLDVTPEMLSQHNKPDDCWICIKGRVYNVTPYLEFHPGGVDEMLRGAGIDATELFNTVHRWVNFEGMLRKCLVGQLKLPELDLTDLLDAID